MQAIIEAHPRLTVLSTRLRDIKIALVVPRVCKDLCKRQGDC